MFRIGRPGYRFDAAICSALLAPDVSHSASPTDFEYVSGGCWSEDLESTFVAPKDSSELRHSRSSFGSWHDLQCSNCGTEECTGISDITRPVWNRDLETTGHSCARDSRFGTRYLSSRHANSKTRLGRAFANMGSNPTTIGSCTGYTGMGYDRMHPDESSELGHDVLRRSDPTRDSKRQKVSHTMRTRGQRDGVYESDIGSDTDPELYALPAVNVPADMSTDAVSITASSAVLSPAMMPRVIRGGTMVGEGSDCDSVDTTSAYSVEADEIIGTQSQAWKQLFRGVLHRTRLIRGLKGQKMDRRKGRFTL
jgi:hypothetical protein